MKILVTSGGTKIPIDRVRDITNMSKGTFGSKIATELLKLNQEVFFYKAKGSKSPYQFTVDMLKQKDDSVIEFLAPYKELLEWSSNYREVDYTTFDEYKDGLERLVKIERPDVVVLAAAVSDYGVENPFNGKVRSNDLLSIKLVQLPKIIYYIKEWHPDAKVVGFKMLVESKTYELIEAAKRSISDNKCEMIVANDLEEMQRGKHRIHLVYPNKEPSTYEHDPNDPNFLARIVANNIIDL